MYSYVSWNRFLGSPCYELDTHTTHTHALRPCTPPAHVHARDGTYMTHVRARPCRAHAHTMHAHSFLHTYVFGYRNIKLLKYNQFSRTHDANVHTHDTHSCMPGQRLILTLHMRMRARARLHTCAL